MKVKEFDILYARDSKGKIRSWEIKVIPINDNANTEATIVQQSGLLLGKKTSKSTKVTKGKNIGKANETTPFNQAVSNAQSKHNSKVLDGYKDLDAIDRVIGGQDLKAKCSILDNIAINAILDTVMPKDNTDKDGFSRPMKAQQYWNHLKDGTVPRIKFPCLGQPKINGFRCVAFLNKETNRVIFKSKKGLTYAILEHIEAELLPIFTAWERLKKDFGLEIDLVLDGEMYIPGEILSNIASAVKKRSLMTSTLEYHVFDLSIADIAQLTRSNYLKQLMFKGSTSFVKHVDYVLIETSREAERLTDKWISEGYEGGIFRAPEATYKFGQRPMTMTKLKRKESEEFEILDVIDTEKAPGLGMFVCQNDLNDKTFEVVPQGTHETRKKYLDDKVDLIGKPLTVEFYERTKDDLPFHAVGIAVRDYE